MFLRILRKDLKRKRTMNTIMLLFIILASMFVASGLNNVVTVMNGTDYYLDMAGINDYIVLTMGENSVGVLEDVLDKEETVSGYKCDYVFYGAKDNLKTIDDKELEAKNSVLYQSIEESSLRFFDKDNNEISNIKAGHAYASGKFMSQNNFETGDKIKIQLNDVELEVTLDGKAKDAFLGSDLMGNTRILLSKSDIDKFYDNEELCKYSRGEIYYISCSDNKKMTAMLSDVDKVAFSGDRSTIKMCYVMDMIIAFTVLILSICLIIVSFVVLKFSISFTIAEEFREIGVMKAIGIGNFKIRSLYLTKYLMLSVVGAIAGFFASIPFGRMLIKSVSENMVLGNEESVLTNIIGALIVVIMIFAFAFSCTGKVKKSSPIDAIREGQTGERYKKKSLIRLRASKLAPSFFMAVNDVLSAPKRFLTIIVTFTICSSFVLVIVNTTETMDSDSLIDTFCSRSDVYMTDIANSMAHMTGTKEEFEDYINKIADEITELGMPCTPAIDVQYKYKITSKGESYSVSCQQGINTKMTDYHYIEGIAPANKNEIAITPQIAEMIDATIGDTVEIDMGDEKLDCIIVAYFQSMNQLGKIIRIHEDAPADFTNISSMMAFQFNFTDNPTDEEIDRRIEVLKKHFDNDEIMNSREYCVDCMGVVETMRAVQYLLLGITLIVVILVTILMERTFISDEKSQIAILKAMGFKNSKIVVWHVIRFGIVGLIAEVIAVIASIPLTHLCISPIFGMMGATEVKYVINPVQIILVYPGIIFVMTIIIAALTAMNTNSIKCSDTANIE